jgi:hypothetical protein
LSDIDAANISKAGVEIDKVGAVLSAVSQQFGAEVAPLISDISESFLDATKNAGGVGEIVSKLSDIFVEAAKVAEVFAVVIGSRIVTSLTLAAAAQVRYGAAVVGGTAFVTRATTATAAHAAALGGVTLSARTAAVSIGVLRGGMALLGGPFGVVVLAAAALFTFATRAREATQSTGDLAKNINTLTVEAAGVRLKSLGKTLKEASSDFDKARSKIRNIQRELRRNPNNTRLQADLKGFEDKLASAKKNVETLKTLETELTAIVNDENREATIKNLEKQKELLKKTESNYKDLIAIAERYNKSLRTPFEIYTDEINLLEKLNNTRLEGSKEGLLSNQDFARGSAEAFEKFKQSLGGSSEEFDKLNVKASESETIFDGLRTASENWSASFADSLVEGGSNFESFANGILKQLQKIALEKAFAPVFGGFGDLIGEVGKSLFDTAVPAFTGSGANSPMFANVGPSLEGGGFTGSGSRSGGTDGRGGFPATLHPNETVIDHTKGQGMGSTSIVVNVDASGSSTQGDGGGRDLGNLIGIAVRSVLIEEKRPGGMLA